MQLTINRKSIYLVTLLLIVVGVVQAQNMFKFPYFQDTEGTNLSNAWSAMTGGDLSPYTYTYDEPPAGSLTMGLWTKLTSQLDIFGLALNQGRVLMLIVHLFTVALLYGVTLKLTQSHIASIVAALIFSFSPLSISFQRRILLDNLMLMWVMLSMYLVLGKDRTLVHYFASALLFGLAIQTKIAALGFLPALFFIIYSQSHKHHRRFAAYQWITITVLLISFFPLYAQMRQELFPQGTLLGGDFPHVSLIQQFADRNMLEFGTGLSHSFNNWIDISHVNADPILIYGGLIATIFVFLLSIENRIYRSSIAMTLAYGLYLVFIKRIYDSDIVVFLPFLAINVGIVVGAVIHLLHQNISNIPVKAFATIFALGVMLYPFYIFYINRTEPYTMDQVSGQIEAMQWVEQNVEKDAVIVSDNFAFVELRKTFPKEEHYWRIDTDPEIKFNLLDDNHCNIDYIISTPQVTSDITEFKLDLMRRAMENSEVLLSFDNNGWPIEVRQVRKDNCPLVEDL